MTSTPRLFRVLLRCYPHAFREEFGDDMALTFARVLADCRTPADRRRLWLATIRESIAGGLHERATARGRPATPPLTTSTSTPMDTMLQDLRFSVRSLRRRPGFVGAVVVTLALGIGANTAIFSLIDAVLLHPVPVHDAERVVSAFHRLNARAPYERFTFPLYRHLAGQLRSVQGLAGFHVIDIGVRIEGRAEQMQIAGVSANYFDVLGLRPQVGRLLHAADDGPTGGNPVVVLGDGAWSRFFDRRPAAVGATLHAGGIAYTIIGVAPRGFRGTDLTASPELWFPIQMSTSLGEGGLFTGRSAETVFETTAFGWVELVARLRDGVTPQMVATELNTATLSHWRSVGEQAAAGRDTMTAPVSVLPLSHAAALGDRETLIRFVTILSTVVLLTLLIACVNVANLLIIRGTERAREIAVRAALGASRGRLTRQALMESAVLATLGAAVAAGVGLLAMRLLAAFALPGGVALDRLDLGLNARVLGFTAGSAAVAAMCFGWWPALRTVRAGTSAVLRGHGGNAGGGPRGGLVIAQAAISILLLVGAGLFIRSLQAGLATDLGFDPRGLAAATVDPSLHGYTPERKAAFYATVVERARLLPGVEAAAIGSQVPLQRMNRLPMSPIGQSDDRSARIGVGLVHVSPGYFDVLRVPLRRGRMFSASDDVSAERVAIVNASAAERLSPDIDIVGREITMLGVITYRVVGVVEDTKYVTVRDSAVPAMFTPVAQPTGAGASLIVRSRSPRTVLPALTRLLHEVDPNIPVRDARLVTNQVNVVLMPQRFGATLLSVLALVALCISTVGIYGVVAYGVSRRSRELGIRIALGASRQHIVREVALRSAMAIGAGMGIGIAAAGFTSRGVEQFLYGVTRLDVIAFAGAVAVLAIAATFACWTPVRRALRVDPMSIIRTE